MTEIKLVNTFKGFCSRMWLDYSDEHITNPDRLNEEEYVSPNDTDEPEKGWWKKELDRRQGRRRPRDTMSLEQFMGEFNKR